MPDAITERFQATVPAVTILATTDQAVAESHVAGTVTAVTYTPEAAVTGAASPASRTLSLVNKGSDGLGTATVASLALGGRVEIEVARSS